MIREDKQMNDQFKKGIENIKEIGMTRYEKDLVLERTLRTSLVSPFWARPVFYNYSFGVLLLLFVVGGGASLSAERAVPGDLLYPLKTKVNEPLRGAVIINQVRKIDWESEKIERRLEEAEVLSGQEDISEKNLQEIEKNIDKSLESLDKTLEKNEEKNSKKSSEAQFKLRVRADAHEKIIQNISEKRGEKEKEKIETLNKSIKNKIDKKIEDIEKRKERKEKEEREGEED